MPIFNNMNNYLESLRFPIGQYETLVDIDIACINLWIDEIAAFPAQLKQVVSSLSAEDLNATYRPGGWTALQVVHHLADSHMNSYIRFKLAMTEENPTIRPYFEDRWAECEEAKHANPAISISLLETLHARWVLFFSSLKANDWERTFYHPENQRSTALKEALGIYAWHGNHHLNHILLVKNGDKKTPLK